jgi:hypothetical protein
MTEILLPAGHNIKHDTGDVSCSTIITARIGGSATMPSSRGGPSAEIFKFIGVVKDKVSRKSAATFTT